MDSELYIKLLNEIKELNEKVDRLNAFKECAKCSHCDNKAKHSDGSMVWCGTCWEQLTDPKYEYFV